jgi:integrase
MALEALGTPTESANVTTAALFEAFLDWSQRNNEASTYESYLSFLQSFCDLHGAVAVRDLKPYHVTRWLDGQPGWGQSTRRAAITAIKRALNWAADEELIPANPLKKVKKPPIRHRDRVLTPQEQQAIAAVPRDGAFKDFLFAMEQTGCRPGEIAGVTAEQVDLETGTWTFKRHKTVKKTSKPRVVYLTPPMIELCRRLVAKHPTGPLFRNSRGKPWNRNSIRCRFRRVRQKLSLGKGVVAYSYRHTYATAGLEGGVPIATMAELLGHTSTDMINEHYGHLDQKTAHLREAARRAVGPREGA